MVGQVPVNRIRTCITKLLSASIIGVLMLAACGGGSDESEPAGPARTVDIAAKEYSFNGDPGTIAAGDTITFVVSNTGSLDHQMQVLDGDGRQIDQTARLSPGQTGEVTVTFEDSGPYRLICDIDDHLSRGQSAGLTVVDS
jgi:plastocyanin